MERLPDWKNGFFLTKRQRYDAIRAQLDTDWFTFLPQYRDLNDYFLPSRGRFILSMDSNRGDRRNLKIYDTTGYKAARTAAAGMQAGMTSPARPWKRLTTPDPDLAEKGDVRQWLELVDQRMTTLFLRSNLYNVLPISYADVATFGTAAILMEKDMNSVFRFTSFPLGSYRIWTNVFGQVEGFYRDYRMTIKQLIDHFGRYDSMTGKPDWSVFSLYVKQMYERGQYQQWVEVSHIIEPNPDYNPRKFGQKFKKYSSCYYERTTREHSGYDDLYLRESGYDYFPVLVPRWQVTGLDAYGTDCPGMAAIGDNKELQRARVMRAKAIAKMIDPPMKASSSMKSSRTSLVSGDITYLEDDNAKFEPAQNLHIELAGLQNNIQELRDSIKETFFVDVFMPILSDPQPDRTATEVNEIKEERLLALGPVLEQLNQDLYDPLIENAFFLMHQAGLVPPPPQEIAGQPIKVEYISIMAQAQRLIGISSMDRLIQMIGPVSQIDPSAAKKIDCHEFVDQYAEALGVSPKIILADDKVQALVAKQQQDASRAQAPQNLAAMAGAAKDLSDTDLSGDSALSRLLDTAKAGSLVQQ